MSVKERVLSLKSCFTMAASFCDGPKMFRLKSGPRKKETENHQACIHVTFRRWSEQKALCQKNWST